MASSASDPLNREAVLRRQNRGPAYKFLVPLIYAPVLPLIRIGLRRNPVLRDRVFYGVLAGAFAHGLFLVFPLLVDLVSLLVIFICCGSSKQFLGIDVIIQKQEYPFKFNALLLSLGVLTNTRTDIYDAESK